MGVCAKQQFVWFVCVNFFLLYASASISQNERWHRSSESVHLSMPLIFFSSFFFCLFATSKWMRASVHHCSVSLLEKKNVCFFTVGRPVDDAKQGNLREREKKDSLGRLIRWKCLKANSAKQFKGDFLIIQNSTEDGLGIKDFLFLKE